MKTPEENIAEDATGCEGAGDYRKYAESQGYGHCEVYEWGSSAGDWTFIVSKDGEEWYVMTQANNYPRHGFTRVIETDFPYFGNSDDVLKQIWAEWS